MRHFEFDFKSPDYISVFKHRASKLQKIRQDLSILPSLKEFYRLNPDQFITDWGCTIDPRNVKRGLPVIVPFILFDKQIEWVKWVMDRWEKEEFAITEKSREMGLSWLSVALSCAICLFNNNASIGFGSRKESYVDKLGDPKAILSKVREFMTYLPSEFKQGWDIKKHAPHMRIHFPGTNSIIAGEAGDGIGRGDRTSLYFVDESAHIERPELIEASLSDTTNCRIDISTPCGTNNPFYRKKVEGKIPRFTFHWRDDPRKDDAWYQKRCAVLDPIVIAQELDLNYSASVEGIVIPNIWVNAAIDAHKHLGIDPSGIKQASLDIADEGKDVNAFAGRHGILLEYIESWSGKDSDIYSTVEKSLAKCRISGYKLIYYDADGLGAGVRGDARIINDRFPVNERILIEPFRGSGKIVNPTQQMVMGRKNDDFFSNAKAQAWWALRMRFQETYRAVREKLPYDKDKIISISSQSPEYLKLVTELSQPTYSLNGAGKVVVDKMPDGSKSPNLADAVMILFSPQPYKNYL